MKKIFNVIALAALVVVILIFRNVAAQSPEPQATQPAANPIYLTPIPPAGQSTAGQSSSSGSGIIGWGMGLWHRMMGGGEENSGTWTTMEGPSGRMGNGSSGMGHGMMTSEARMADDVAWYLGMTNQDLYNQMAAGKSMAQIAAEKGITEQQLMDSIMASRRAAYDQAVQAGYMTRMNADTMLENINSNLKMMVNDQGYGSNGWNRMWEAPSQPGPDFSGMHH